MRATDRTLRYLATRAGTGNHGAFRCLYRRSRPRPWPESATICPIPFIPCMFVRATFCEVWWMCAFDTRCGTHRHDVARWVASIAERRCDERRQALDLAVRDGPSAGQTAFWTGLLADHHVWTQFQLATMLDGHDAVDLLSTAPAY